MADSLDAPVFANRYRFEPVSKDWDKGRSGYTHLVYDLKEKRLGVIKRAETLSAMATASLRDEVHALRLLRGQGVPEVYDVGQTVYGSKNYFYVVLEYIDGLRVERELDSLSVSECIDIIIQLFRLLREAHRRGIANGDVDLKHLFWRRDKKRLVVIDWGNARLGVNTNKQAEFTDDLARSAEIIFSLVTRQHPPSTGSVALPNDSVLEPSLRPVPAELRELCAWAPRTPSDNVKPPYSASALLNASKKWRARIGRSEAHKSSPPTPTWLYVVGGLFALAALAALLITFVLPKFPLLPATAAATPVSTETSVIPSVTPFLTQTATPTAATQQSVATPTEIQTSGPTVIPSPLAYSPILVFDNVVTFSSSPLRLCWRNANSPLDLAQTEGFYRRADYDYWIFGVGAERPTDQPVEVDFSECVLQNPVGAMALNAFVTRLQPEKDDMPVREFGIFLADRDGQRREYTFWIDRDNKMYLRIRENGTVSFDEMIDVVSLANLQTDGSSPERHHKFPVQIFFEIDNEGRDILHLQEAPYNPVGAEDLKPSGTIEGTERPAFSSLQKIGLIGYGGETKVIIWPLVFFEK